MEIDELKNIWKEGKAGEVRSADNIYGSLMDMLKKAERKVIFRYVLMTFFMAMAFYTLGGKVLGIKHFEPLTYAGMYLLFAAMITVAVFVWSTVIILNKKNISSPSIEFIRQIKAKFERRKLIRRIVIPLYLAAITIGVTLVYLEVLQNLPLMNRIMIHVFVVLFLLLISWIAAKREKRRYEKTYKPIEKRIDELLKEYDLNNK